MNPENTLSPQSTSDDEALTSEALIEEVSIDGMCGVY
jgi:mycofactocin precursor